MTEHTALPLKIIERIHKLEDRKYYEIWTDGGLYIMLTHDADLAAFIVRACNSHQELVEALEYYAECGDACTCGNRCGHGVACAVLAKVEEAAL